MTLKATLVFFCLSLVSNLCQKRGKTKNLVIQQGFGTGNAVLDSVQASFCNLTITYKLIQQLIENCLEVEHLDIVLLIHQGATKPCQNMSSCRDTNTRPVFGKMFNSWPETLINSGKTSNVCIQNTHLLPGQTQNMNMSNMSLWAATTPTFPDSAKSRHLAPRWSSRTIEAAHAKTTHSCPKLRWCRNWPTCWAPPEKMKNISSLGDHRLIDTVDGRNPSFHHLWCRNPFVNTGINYPKPNWPTCLGGSEAALIYWSDLIWSPCPNFSHVKMIKSRDTRHACLVYSKKPCQSSLRTRFENHFFRPPGKCLCCQNWRVLCHYLDLHNANLHANDERIVDCGTEKATFCGVWVLGMSLKAQWSPTPPNGTFQARFCWLPVVRQHRGIMQLRQHLNFGIILAGPCLSH